MSAVDGEHLKLVTADSTDPTGDLGRFAVPWARVRVAVGGNTRGLFGEVVQQTERNPIAWIFLFCKT